MTFIILGIAYLITRLGLYKIFEKVDIPTWKALIPIYSELEWCKLVGRPTWHVIMLFVPIVGFFIGAGMLIDLCKSFKRFGFWQHAAAVTFPFIYLPLMGMDKNLSFLGPVWSIQKDLKKRYKIAQKTKDKKALKALTKENPFPKKGLAREWSESIIFAVFAAHFIRMFLIEAYTIPTESMEGSLLVGDFLFVSKAHYGSRMPMTPVSFPLLHNTMPFTGGESYSKSVKWGYHRAPAIQNVERYDPVVFNYPEGDTIIKGAAYPEDYHNMVRQTEIAYTSDNSNNDPDKVRKALLRKLKSRIAIRPVDKRDHYIKRCVGIPGDKIQVDNGILKVNDEVAPMLDGIWYEHKVEGDFSPRVLTKKYGDLLSIDKARDNVGQPFNAIYTNPKIVERLEKEEGLKVNRHLDLATEQKIFPYDRRYYKWSNDNYGPITVPKRGDVIQLSPETLPMYERIITAYEEHKLERKDGKYYIDDKETSEYTIEMNYYWMMGDNRNRSADSRSWGFVPEDHIVGKPLFVWLSLKNGRLADGVRWDRLFMGASGK
ncbi:MAG: signal peptidase I [Saprospiraceae bacterium]|nr:signal peptidase I [Saprospiraceae bacterium]